MQQVALLCAVLVCREFSCKAQVQQRLQFYFNVAFIVRQQLRRCLLLSLRVSGFAVEFRKHFVADGIRQ
ncbi:hypothetical protein CO157_02150 [Candidatus Peregrinibacteria bacterium CG_4_9_14_3_um_filter_49_12]|nr:MAG: hypothetical protein COV83_04685 [Candidatus Peregrinibacteria bacterium CG11_big_fil_rev_8_21_14_0_20_49_14]PJA67938.1 MAG: hypothetical protein CO157_02150 [Candidatus Peregrinibacteria bacterium CG_4_9_14_3_um_filter_49_12]